MNDDRVMNLEIKFAHQERAVEQLEKTVFAQHRLIEDLTKQLKRLTDKFEAAVTNEVGPSDQKPPHY